LRSKNSSSDFATTFDVVEEVIKCYSNINLNFDYTCCIYPCAPFATKEKIKQGFELLIKKKFDCIMPIIEYGHPIQRALIQKSKSKIDYLNSEFKLTRSQDLEKRFYDAGQFYWLNTLVCLQKCSIFTDNTGGILISELEAQDIDNSTDWKLAEFKYKLL
jgi:N-acylneuraminate cytidylyltransferase